MPRAVTCLAVVALLACTAADPPSTRETVHLTGTDYERGLQHGTELRSKIRSFYTTMLTASLLPYVNREKPDIAGTLQRYAGPDYDENFSYKLLLESAEAMKAHIAPRYLEEMRGIADGSGLQLTDILVLNTFVDSVMCTRGVALALRLSQSPIVEQVAFSGPIGADGVDNDGDGATDEKNEGLVDEYDSIAHAVMAEVSVDATISWVLADADGIDPKTLRAQLDDTIFTFNSPELRSEALPDTPGEPRRLKVTLTPSQPLPAAATVTLMVMAGDLSTVSEPPPSHARFMRDERITFTTAGLGSKPWQVPNTGRDDGRSQPPSTAFAVRGSATVDGKPILAQHFSLLDANSSHKHTAIFVHHPPTGPSYAYVGWAGVIWGFSGLNANGLAVAANYSDTLKNSVVNGLLKQISKLAVAPLLTTGVPIGLALRELLETGDSAAAAAKALDDFDHTFGWNVILADASGALRSVEIDSLLGGTARAWAPGDKAGRDDWGQPLASVGVDDIRAGTHFVKNTDDMSPFEYPLPNFRLRIRRQSGWSSYYFRSLRAFGRLGDLIRDNYGKIDAAKAKQLVADPALVDTSDSMNAVVIEPATLRIHTSMGTVPATDSAFETVQLEKP